MKITFSVFGIIAGILGFISAFTIWLNVELYFDVGVFSGTLDVELGLEPYVLTIWPFDFTFFEELSNSRTSMVIGSILCLIFFNKFIDEKKDLKYLAYIGLIGLFMMVYAIYNFIVTLLSEIDTSTEVDLNVVVLPGIGLILVFIAMIASVLAFIGNIGKKKFLQRMFVGI